MKQGTKNRLNYKTKANLSPANWRMFISHIGEVCSLTNTRFFRSLLMLLLMVAGTISVCAQEDLSGTYYIGSYGKNADASNKYYLCPTEGWYYYQTTDGYVANDNSQPFLTTYKCLSTSNYDTSKAVWIIEKHETEAGCYYIKQKTATPGRYKYIVSNGQISGSSNANRMRIHIEELDENSTALNNLGNMALFEIATYPAGNGKDYNFTTDHLRIIPHDPNGRNGNYIYLVVNNGNFQNLKADGTRPDGPNGTYGKGTGGIISLYTLEQNAGWYLEDVIERPTISFNTDNKVQITGATGTTKIYYTTNGDKPTIGGSTTTEVEGATVSFDPADNVTTIKAIAIVNGEATNVTTFTPPVLLGSNHKRLIQSQTNPWDTDFHFYMIPGDPSNDITKVNTTSLFRPTMEWYFESAGIENGIQYYYIVNPTTSKNLCYDATNGVYMDTKTTTDNKFKFSIVASGGAFNIIPHGLTSGNRFINKDSNNADAKNINLTGSAAAATALWKFVMPSALDKDAAPFSVSDDTSTSYYKIENIGKSGNFIVPPTGTATFAEVTASSEASANWYFEVATPADNNDWLTYYYIRNAKTGDYLYFSGTNNSRLEMRHEPETGENAPKYQFTWARTASIDQYYIVPRLWKDRNLNQIASLQAANNATTLSVAQTRTAGYNAWEFDKSTYKCATPTITFNGSQYVISKKESDANAKIKYTLDGTTWNEYTGPLDTPSSACTIKAYVYRSGDESDKSDEATFEVTQVATPAFDYSAGNSIIITCATEGATIYYTTNGTDPSETNNGTQYTQPLTDANVTANTTIKAIAVKAGSITSAIGTSTVTYGCAAPIIRRGIGTTFTLECTYPTTGVTIRYTLDGSEPTTSTGTVYNNQAVSFNSYPITVKAIAIAEGYSPSVVAVKTINEGLDMDGDVYLIHSAGDLGKFVTMVNNNEDGEGASAHYRLMANVSGSGISEITTPFTGIFEAGHDANGNYYTITDLSHALFNTVNGGTVKNVMLDNVNINVNGNAGAIANEATGAARIYNCGILATGTGSTVEKDKDGYDKITKSSSTISGSNYVGSIVGLLDDEARVINCFSFADIKGGSYRGGIVGYNNVEGSNSANLKTMVMNCMYYGNIYGGNKAPIYNGYIITNRSDQSGVSNFNYFWSGASYTNSIDVYNCALSAETRYLQRFEFYRPLLNSNRELAAWWATGSRDNKKEMLKWVMEPSQIGTSTPFPILKAPGYYPSVVNIDAENAPNTSDINKGRNLGTLSVTISDVGSNAPDGAAIISGKSSLSLPITDKDPAHFNFNYYKVQLPYYNEVGTGNYTHNKVVTGWKVTVSGGTHSYSSDGSDATAAVDEDGNITLTTPYNFADRKSTGKDNFGTSGRVFSQGAYFDVPEGVTSITIEPYWAQCVYVSDPYPDVVYDQNMSTANNVQTVGTVNKQARYTNGQSYPINGDGQVVYTTMSNAAGQMPTSGTVYDNAIVLVGNVHSTDVSDKSSNKAFTIMSIDLDKDNEPDYSYILRYNSRLRVHPVRVDFVNIPGLGMAQKSTGGTGTYNFGIMQPLGWFESTNTSLFRFTQFEYDFAGRANSPMILQGGVIEQWVTVGGKEQHLKEAKSVSYYHVGGNVWFKEFHIGVHQDKTQDEFVSPHPPISVTGGDFNELYLTGLYNTPNANYDDNAECYINGGRFGKVAGTGMQGIGAIGGNSKGNIIWQIDNADIDEFYAGGINAAHIAEGNIYTVITNSRVDQFCGGPKFGNMNSTKKVVTNATNCTFRAFFGAGYGGNSYNRRYPDNKNNINGNSGIGWDAWVKGQYTKKYDANYKGVETRIDYQFLPMSNNTQNVARLFVDYVSFSLATTYDVTSKLSGCTITTQPLGRLSISDDFKCLGNFYGGGSLGKVSGDVKSTLTNCTVEGSVFGAGYSATLPKVNVMNNAFQEIPHYDENTGAYTEAILPTTEEYSWEHKEAVNSTATAIDTITKKLYTTENLTELGTVTGKVTLNIENGTTITGSVYGGGESSDVYGKNTSNEITSEVEVNIEGGSMTDVYGGGYGANTVVGGDIVVNIGAKNGSTLSGNGMVSGNVYGGSAMGAVNTSSTKDAEGNVTAYTPSSGKTTNVNIYAGDVTGSVFGGGLGRLANGNDPNVNGYLPAIAAHNFGNTFVTMEGGTVSTGLYGGANTNGVLKGNSTVTITGGTIGTAWTTPVPNPLPDVVFGGGYGQPTLVEGNVEINLGAANQTTPGAIINGSVYGGGALGNVNTSKPESTLVFDATKTTKVNLFKGTVKGSVYGGGLGQKEEGTLGQNGYKAPVESFVGGDVTVELNKDVPDNQKGCIVEGAIFGCNNANGTPKGNVTVHIYGTQNAAAEHITNQEGDTNENTKPKKLGRYDLAAVYGGGNQAAYYPTVRDTIGVTNGSKIRVTIEGCDRTSIQYVYGGGNAAPVPATDVTIESSFEIYNVFGGGNGQGEGNPGADVGIINKTKYDANNETGIYGTGIAETKLIGGTINTVYGGSNTKGNVRGRTSVSMPSKNDNCPLNVTAIYGAGQNAEQHGDVALELGCGVGDIYGGAKNANIQGNVNIVITGGHHPRVFGGNDTSGTIHGTISVNIEETNECDPITIGELYLGGNNASYSTYGYYVTITNGKPDVLLDENEEPILDNNNQPILKLLPRTSTSDTNNPIKSWSWNSTENKFDYTNYSQTGEDIFKDFTNPVLNVISCTSIGKIFGGGLGSDAIIYGSPTVNLNMIPGIHATDGELGRIGVTYTDPDDGTKTKTGGIFGGGNKAKVVGNTTINIGTESTVTMKSEKDATTSEYTTHAVEGANVISNIYGGGNEADVDGNTTLNIGIKNLTKGVNITGDIFGGGYGATTRVTGDVVVNIGKRTNTAPEGDPVYAYEGYANITGDVYGGSAQGKVNSHLVSEVETATEGKTTQVNLYGGTIKDTDPGTGKGNIYGGGLGEAEHAADVYGPVKVKVIGGQVVNVFGCNNVNGMPKSTVDVEIGTKIGAKAPYTYIGTGTISGSVYGGGRDAACTGSPTVKLYKGTVNTNVYGGGLGSTAVTGGASVIMEGGTVGNDVFGGGSLADVTGNVSVVIAGGTVTNDVYGGGALANTNTGNWDVARLVTTYEKITATLTTGTSVVAGLYKKDGDNYILQGADAKAEDAAEYYRRFDTAWAADKTSASNTTTVTLTGGKIGNVFGGGLGNAETAVYVYGDVTVNVNKAEDRTTYGGTGAAFTREIAQNIDVAGTHYPTVPTTGNIFGANNFNGSPKGNVTVEIFATKRVDGKAHVLGDYEIQAVYGGGNLANYLPATGKETKVIVHGCDDTSIDYVYGGGNSASVPSTDVTIYGAFDIGYAFGGGNGSKPVKNSADTWVANGGAMVTGNAKISARGGRIGQVFGGSDAKGDILGSSTADVQTTENQECTLTLTRLFGAGNEANVAGDVNMILSGCASDNVQYVHGGSYNAHISGNVNLTITSGYYTNVFGGNDARGSIGGNINVNIEETDDCKPIVIHHLVGAGNEAPYPGTKSDGTEYPDDHTSKVTVNIKSATRIDRVFGGGYKANVKGNTEVNINMMKGSKAGAELVRPASYTGDVIPNVYVTEGTTYINNAIGTIGDVYGGGNEGNVIGSTVVNIGTSTTVPILRRTVPGGAFITSAPKNDSVYNYKGDLLYDLVGETKVYRTVSYEDKPVLGANITGNVYGGGNLAYVTGNTTVNISTVDLSAEEDVSIGNSVYGGGNSADVHGNTNVNMGGGYVCDGVYGGGLHGSVGSASDDADAIIYHTGTEAHSNCIGKIEKYKTNTGKCTVVVSGGQVGPVEAALATGGMKNTGRHLMDVGASAEHNPVDVGFVFGAGRGEVENPDTDPDADFRTYVKETDVTISGGIVMASVYGGGENGRVRGNTLVKIQGGQIGCGEGKVTGTGTAADPYKPKIHSEAEWTDANPTNFSDCASWDFGEVVNGKTVYLPYDPLANVPYRDGSTVTNGSTIGSDGHTYYGYVFGGGSGYFPYEIKDADGNVIAHDWLASAGVVEGNTKVEITGGHILTCVYGGNELTSVTGDSCVVIMTGGTLGVPRSDEYILKKPVTCYLFGGGKGDQREHFKMYTNVKNTRVEVKGTARIFGSVFGGAEDGHVSGNAKVNILGTARIGMSGTSYVDGNIFGGGRGFSGTELTAGTVKGNTEINISGTPEMYGSIYGGGRLASVGVDFAGAQNATTGQFVEDGGGKTYGHVTINISGGTIGKEGVTGDGAKYSGNVFGGSMGRLTLLDDTPNSLWNRMAQVKTSSVNITGGTIKRNVYGGAEFGTTRDHVYVTVGGTRAANGDITPSGSPVINGSVFGGGKGSTEHRAAYNSYIEAGSGDNAVKYLFTPLQYAGCIGGDTYVNVVGSGHVNGSVYGGGELASVGVIDYRVDEADQYTQVIKHSRHSNDGKEVFYDFGLSWPYEFKYVEGITGGTTHVNITGSAAIDSFVYGGGKGQVSFGDDVVGEGNSAVYYDEIDKQRYTEAHIANVRKTEVTIGTSNVVDNPTIRTVYGGGEDGHVIEDAKITIHHGTIQRSVFGGGKGTSTYEATLLDPTKDTPTAKGSPEAVYSWTAGKVYGNTTVTMNGGQVGWFIYGGGNMASVGKGNYTGGSDDYSTGGYGELPSDGGVIWTASPGFDPDAEITDSNKPATMADYFLSSGKTTVTIMGGNVGPTSGTGADADGIPYGSIFGGSRGKAAKTITKSPRYKYGPDFFLGYVNKANINIGGTPTSELSANTPNIYGSIYGGGQDGHVRNSTEVRIFKGNVSGQGDYRSGNVFGAGSGVGKYTDDEHSYCNNASGSVTCSTLVEVSGGTIANSVYGGGALASVGPPKIGQDKNEQKAASDDHKSYSCNTVNIEGGSIGGSVYAASRGPAAEFLASAFTDGVSSTETGPSYYNPTRYATSMWTELNVTGGSITGSVYGGGEMGQVKESTDVQLTGGSIAHDAYGGGKGTVGTNAIEANVGGNTTVELNKGVDDDEKGCSVSRIFGCNDLNGTPKGHVTVHVYGTQHPNTTAHSTISGKYAKFKKISEYTVSNYTDNTNDDDLKKLATAVGMTTSEITAYEDAISGGAGDAAKATALENYIEAIGDKKYDVLAVYGGGNLAAYEPTDRTENTDVIIDGCDLTSIKQVYGGGNAASTPANQVRINAAYEIHEAFGGGNGKDAYEIDGKWYENPGANVGYYATYHHVTTDPEKGTQSAPYPAVVNDDADTPEERRATTSYHYGKGTTNLEITGGRIHTTYGGSNTRGNVRAEVLTTTEDAGVCDLLIDASYPAGKSADTDAGSKVEAKCVDYVAAIYGGAQNANVYSDVVIDITNGTYGKIFGGNDRSGRIYGSITINVHEEGCKPIVIGELYGGGNEADYSIYGFNDDGSARTKAEYDALTTEQKAAITVQRDPQINIISATRIGTIYGGGYNAMVIGNPSINVNMEKGYVNSKYATDAKFNEGSHEVTEYGMDCSYIVEEKDADGKAILAIGTIGSIYGGGFKGDVQGNTSVAIGTGEWLSFTGQRETTDADGKVYTYNTTTQKWDWTQTVEGTPTSGTADNKPVPARNAATILGNVFGGGEGEALEETATNAFLCAKAMVGVVDSGEGSTSVTIANGTVGTLSSGTLVAGTGNVYGGGMIGRVEKNTVVTIGVEGETGEDTKYKPVIRGNVFGAGKGNETHGYAGLVRGNSTVTIQGAAKVERSVYGGGEKATVGRYNVVDGRPTTPAGGGVCTVTVKDDAEIGPDNMIMTRSGGPDDSGYIFGAGKGVTPNGEYTFTGDDKPHQMTGGSVWTTIDTEEDYLAFIETLGLAAETHVTVSGNAFIKGSVYGGAENGYVQENTNVTIAGGQIGNGYVQMADDGTLLASPYSLNRRYTAAEWEAGHLIKDGESNYTSSLPECASWPYGADTNSDDKNDLWEPYDKFANADGTYPTGSASADAAGGRPTGSDGHTFYGNVFGGGSGYFPYKAGKWHEAAGAVGGNTTVTITGGHILTNIYGGNEMTNVKGNATINFGGNATLGVPRTLGQIAAHPVTCYLFGGGKGDPRVFFNKLTNVNNVNVNVTGGIIYGSVFGGGEDGHVLGNVAMNIQNIVDDTDPENPVVTSSPVIGTWGTSYVDGNIFGGGRGFSGEAYTAGNVGGSVTLNISGGTMLGSIYGGGRLGSVGYGLYMATQTEAATGEKMYGEMQEDGYGDWYSNGSGGYDRDTKPGFKRGYVTMNISGGTIGNEHEFIVPAAGNIPDGLPADFKSWTAANWTTWKNHNHVPYTEYDTATGMLTHTKGGNVFGGGMGRYTQLDGETPISTYDASGNLTSDIEWKKLGNAKSTNLTISGDDTWIMGNVYGGGEFGAVQGTHTTGGDDWGTEINITGGTIGTEITASDPVKATVTDAGTVTYTYGSVFGGGTGSIDDVTAVTPVAQANRLSAYVANNTKVAVTDAIVRASVYGGGELSAVGGDTHVIVSGNTEIGRNEVKPISDPNSPGYVMFGGWCMGNVYGGGRGHEKAAIAGLVKGNTNILIQNTVADAAYAAEHDDVSEGDVLASPKVYHNVYGGGALGSVGSFFVSGASASDGGSAPENIPYGVPYWSVGQSGTSGAEGTTTNTGLATVTITGGTIGISGRDNGLVFGSSRGDIAAPTVLAGSPAGTAPMDQNNRLAWVRASAVTIGTVDAGRKTPLVRGSVYGGGENGHNYQNATVTVNSGTIGIADKNPVTNEAEPWWDFGTEALNTKYRADRGNVYGAGSGADTYTGTDGKEHHSPRAGMVGGSTVVNITGGHIGRSVYGAGSMASLGNITNFTDTIDGGSAKHLDENSGFALSWPYQFNFVNTTGKATVNVKGGHIGTKDVDGGDVYGSARGEAGDRYATAHLAYANETEVNINYPTTATMTSEAAIQDNYDIPCVTGSVHGSGEDGYVYGDTYVTLEKGLIGHGLYGGGKGKGTYTKTLNKIGGGGTYEAKIYSLISGKVFGNTYVTMNGGHVGRNVYGGGNMGSVGKGNYAGGADDYYPAGYGETITGNLWTSSYNPEEAVSESNKPDDAYYFLSSGKATVKVLGGTVGFIDEDDPSASIKNDLPYGNVFGGSAGEAAPNITEDPRYEYSPAFFSGYVNETDVTIGKARSDFDSDGAYEAYKANEAGTTGGAPKILGSVYGGGQDGHVRRDTKVTVYAGEIGLEYTSVNQDKLGELTENGEDNPQWLHRGNIYGGGSGITKYSVSDIDEMYATGYSGVKIPASDYSTSSGSVTRFTEVNVMGGTIHRNVYGGGSNGSVGAPKIVQTYDPYKPGQANIDGNPDNGPGRQSMNTVNIGGGTSVVTIGDATGVAAGYGGNVFGAGRGDTKLDPVKFALSIWTLVNIKDKSTILGNVFGGGDNGEVKKDAEVIVGDE